MINLTQRNKFVIKNYVYQGGDTSLTYKYVLSPFAQFCVDYFVPTWVAPNVITFSGLIITVFACFLTILYNPDLSVNCPRWLCYVYAVSIFAYQTLDNMDGKQARRTKSSNALGMLFDHSCDVINTVVIGYLMASAVGTGWTMYSFLGHVAGYIPFFFQTWEEFHLGTMVLPVFNGPSEGLLMSVSICLISATLGSQWWHEARVVVLPPWVSLTGQASSLIINPLQLVIGIAFFLMITTAIYQVFKGLYSMTL